MHYCISDIHGQLGLFREMLDMIHLSDEDTLYILGDMIDRGPDSIGVLQEAMSRPNVVPFIGNHELMMLDYLNRNGADPDVWLSQNNGGKKTLKAFKALPAEEQNRILDYIRSSYVQLNVTIGEERFLLSHSCFITDRTDDDIRFTEATDIQVFYSVWYSPYRFWEYAAPEVYNDGKIHVIGHVPALYIPENGDAVCPFPNPELGEKILDIDGGCARISFNEPGGLCCLRLEPDENGKRVSWMQFPG